MSISQNYKELFRCPTITEIVFMFQSLLDSRDIEPDEALALAGAIHAGLRNPQGLDGSVYARYAQTMALLNHYMPNVDAFVIANWHLPSTRANAIEKAYDDSLFDDTTVMQAQVGKSIYESNTENEK